MENNYNYYITPYLRLGKIDRKALLLSENSEAKNRLSPYFIEKDFWITEILRVIYTVISPQYRHLSLNPFIIKGGTTLHKCLNIVERLSEDIDLSISVELLGLQTVNFNELERRNETELKVNKIVDASNKFVQSELLPKLKSYLCRLDNEIYIKPDLKCPSNIEIYYPRALDDSMYNNLTQSRVVIEAGSKCINSPNLSVSITHRLGILDKCFVDPKFYVTILSPERTLMEKVFGVHSNNIKNKFRKHYSRHLYDIIRIFKVNPLWAENHYMLKSVAEFNYTYYRWNADICKGIKNGPIQLVPQSDLLFNEYREDWINISFTFFYGKIPCSFDQLIKELYIVEHVINKKIGYDNTMSHIKY